MISINRTAIVVRPGQAFLDWLHAADPTSSELTLENPQREPTVYLLPDCDDEQEVRECLEELCGQIFEEQLDGWYRVPSSWPTQRDLANFDRWFEWSFHSMVFDLCDDPLLQEEIDCNCRFGAAGYPRFQFLDVTRYAAVELTLAELLHC